MGKVRVKGDIPHELLYFDFIWYMCFEQFAWLLDVIRLFHNYYEICRKMEVTNFRFWETVLSRGKYHIIKIVNTYSKFCLATFLYDVTGEKTFLNIYTINSLLRLDEPPRIERYFRIVYQNFEQLFLGFFIVFAWNFRQVRWVSYMGKLLPGI